MSGNVGGWAMGHYDGSSVEAVAVGEASTRWPTASSRGAFGGSFLNHFNGSICACAPEFMPTRRQSMRARARCGRQA
jgi:hypothetical protein